MHAAALTPHLTPGQLALAEQGFRREHGRILRRTDRMFAGLLAFEYLAGIGAALWLSPLTWEGEVASPHVHVNTALVLGLLIIALPITLAFTIPGRVVTRHAVAVGQMLMSALLIHLLGGRIEAHFHIFGSLAFLAFYRDWRVLLTATVVVALDHILRGYYWPRSVYGVASGAEWRWLEHAGWVLFENAFLTSACVIGVRELRAAARREVEMAVAADANARSEEATKAKARFLATVSHEIRTPLNGVVGMTELLLTTPLNARQAQFAGVIRSSADTLLSLINDVLDFSKIEAGKLTLDETDTDVRQLVEEVCDIVAPRAAERGIELISGVAPSIAGSFRADAVRLRQVLMNLVSNAVKFTDRGEVVVRLEPEHAAPGMFRFSVTDTGVGIPPERMGMLFKLFSQVDDSPTRSHGGTGLGLAISRQLVELMGGTIGVESEPGKGSTFWFSLPLRPGLAPVTAPRRLAPGALDDGILIVDDNTTNRQILFEQCRSWGFRVETAADAEEALARFAESVRLNRPYALAILDMQMPRMTGAELARRLKADARFRATRLILLSSLDDAATIEESRESGFDERLVKPVRHSDLYDAVVRALGHAPCATVPGGSRPAERIRSRVATERPVRVLVVEDNAVNQMVARELLVLAGFQVEVVEHGGLALDRLARGGIDLVLMDCNMPVMDGFQATSEIRRLEAAGFTGPGCPAHMPIIALTANAVRGDREECLAAGMDAYVSKPIDPEEMIERIDALLSAAPPRSDGGATSHARATIGEVASPAASAPRANSPSSFDREQLLRRCMGKESLAAEVLAAFEGQLPAQVSAIATAVGEADSSAVARAAHALKGAAANAAAVRLASLAAELESSAKTARIEDAAARLAAIRAEVDRCLAEARAATQAARATGGPR